MKALLLILAALILPMAVLAIVLVAIAAIVIAVTFARVVTVVPHVIAAHRFLLPLRAPPSLLA